MKRYRLLLLVFPLAQQYLNEEIKRGVSTIVLSLLLLLKKRSQYYLFALPEIPTTAQMKRTYKFI